MKTPWSRTVAKLKEFEAKHNDDNAVPRFEPNPSDVRQVLEEHTEALAIIRGLLHLIPAQRSDEAPSMWPEHARALIKRNEV